MGPFVGSSTYEAVQTHVWVTCTWLLCNDICCTLWQAAAPTSQHSYSCMHMSCCRVWPSLLSLFHRCSICSASAGDNVSPACMCSVQAEALRGDPVGFARQQEVLNDAQALVDRAKEQVAQLVRNTPSLQQVGGRAMNHLTALAYPAYCWFCVILPFEHGHTPSVTQLTRDAQRLHNCGLVGLYCPAAAVP